MTPTEKPLTEHKRYLAKRDRLIRAGRAAGMTQRDVAEVLNASATDPRRKVSNATVARVWNDDEGDD